MQLTGTNHPSGLIPFGIACSQATARRLNVDELRSLENTVNPPCGCQGAAWTTTSSRPSESQPRDAGLTSGGQSAVEPPGPIPNPEVKRCSADGIGTTGPVRVGRRQVFARPRVTSGPGAFFVPAGRWLCRAKSMRRPNRQGYKVCLKSSPRCKTSARKVPDTRSQSGNRETAPSSPASRSVASNPPSLGSPPCLPSRPSLSV